MMASRLIVERDADFDGLLGPEVRQHARTHFTPVHVARQVATFLGGDDHCGPRKRVLDVGCGAGKVCIVGALSVRAEFVGVDHREFLVGAGNAIIGEYEVKHVKLIYQDAMNVAWDKFDAFYFYNPFAEQVAGPGCQIDDDIPYSQRQFATYVETVTERLARAKPGTRVATYQGFGGAMPDCYERVREQRFGAYRLECWTKLREVRASERGR